jgi:zinc protease
VNTNNHYTARSLRPEDVEKLNAETIWSYYDARFGNAADFTFFLVGAFDVPAITSLVTTYIGSLPSKGTPATRVGDVRLEFPSDVRREAVRKGKEPKSQTVMSFFADTGLDELEMHRARAAASVLELRLRDQLREALGGTYSVDVGYSNTQPQPGYGMMSVEFGSAPENVDKLVEVVLDETAKLRASGPTWFIKSSLLAHPWSAAQNTQSWPRDYGAGASISTPWKRKLHRATRYSYVPASRRYTRVTMPSWRGRRASTITEKTSST